MVQNTLNEQYEKLRQVIIAANPEIVDLKFGCVIRWNDGSLPDSPITGVEPMSDGDWEVSWGCFNPDLSEPRYKILGRPIRLADVLLAINSQFLSVNSRSGDFMFNRFNDAQPIPFREWFYTNEKGNRCVWDLRHDDLDWHYHNKPETIQFLIDLLCK